MLFLKNLLFTLLVPGATAVLVPYLLVGGEGIGPVAPSAFARGVPLAVIAAGALVYLRCVWDFATLGRGTPAPIDPPRVLVVRGLYRYLRNPMYLGVLLVLVGQVLLFRSGPLALYAGVWLLAVNLFIVLYEEPALSRRFGPSYDRYRAAVGRWIPGRPYRADDG